MGGPRGKLVMSVKTGASLCRVWDGPSCRPGLAAGSTVCVLSAPPPPPSLSDVGAVAAQRVKRNCSI